MSSDEDVDDIENAIRSWHPREVLRRTNWLYRVDALRPLDIREMNLLLDLIYLHQMYAQQFVIWGYSLKRISLQRNQIANPSRLSSLIQLVLKMAQLFLSEGYCFLSSIKG